MYKYLNRLLTTQDRVIEPGVQSCGAYSAEDLTLAGYLLEEKGENPSLTELKLESDLRNTTVKFLLAPWTTRSFIDFGDYYCLKTALELEDRNYAEALAELANCLLPDGPAPGPVIELDFAQFENFSEPLPFYYATPADFHSVLDGALLHLTDSLNSTQLTCPVRLINAGMNNWRIEFSEGFPRLDLFGLKRWSASAVITLGNEPAWLVAASLKNNGTARLLSRLTGSNSVLMTRPPAVNDQSGRPPLVPADSQLIICGEIFNSPGPIGPLFDRFNLTSTRLLAGFNPGNIYRSTVYDSEHKSPTLLLPMFSRSALLSSHNVLKSFLSALILMRKALELKLPFSWVSFPPEGSSRTAIISSRVLYRGYVRRIARLTRFLFPDLSKLIVVDSDIAPLDADEVINDLVQKVLPHRDISFFSDQSTEKEFTLLDATLPFKIGREDLPERVSFEHSYPDQIQQRVVDNWTAVYGLPGKPFRRQSWGID